MSLLEEISEPLGALIRIALSLSTIDEKNLNILRVLTFEVLEQISALSEGIGFPCGVFSFRVYLMKRIVTHMDFSLLI